MDESWRDKPPFNEFAVMLTEEDRKLLDRVLRPSRDPGPVTELRIKINKAAGLYAYLISDGPREDVGPYFGPNPTQALQAYAKDWGESEQWDFETGRRIQGVSVFGPEPQIRPMS